MPELPEVEYGRKVAEETLAGHVIARAWLDEDEIVFEGGGRADVGAALAGARVQSVHRHGKFLYLALEGRPFVLLHFGMTGAVRARAHAPLHLASHGRDVDAAWPPRFAKLALWREADDPEGDAALVFVNARRLGRVRLFSRAGRDSDDPSLRRLGFDPLTEMPSRAAFRRLMDGRRGNLKSLLLNQSFTAGVGNWMADEILYQAGIDPRRGVPSLTAAEVDAIRDALDFVVERAVAVDADKERFPEDWLFHHRWGKREGATTADGERIEHVTLGGRTTAWVPTRQR